MENTGTMEVFSRLRTINSYWEDHSRAVHYALSEATEVNVDNIVAAAREILLWHYLPGEINVDYLIKYSTLVIQNEEK